MAKMSFANKVKQMVKDAPVAQSRVNVNFGPMTVTPMVITFHGKGQLPDKRTLGEFAKEQGVSVDAVELGDNDSFQLHFDIDVSDLNPSLSFHYTRDIAVVASNGKNKTDWAEIVEPGLRKVFGSNWEEVLIAEDGGESDPVYVAAENADSLRPSKDKTTGEEKNYGVPRLIAKFEDRDACIDARDERYPRRDEEVVDDEEDADEEAEDGEDEGEEEYPEALLTQVWGVYKAQKSNRKNTIAFLGKSKKFAEYDAADLLDAAIEHSKRS